MTRYPERAFARRVPLALPVFGNVGWLKASHKTSFTKTFDLLRSTPKTFLRTSHFALCTEYCPLSTVLLGEL